MFKDGVTIDTITAKLVWIPVIQFENMIKFEKSVNYGRTRKFGMWHLANDSLGYNMMYMEKVQLTLRCPFHFHKFPFDSHTCFLELGNFNPNVVLNSTNIIYGNVKTQVGDDPIILSDSPLPFEFQLKSLPSSRISNYGDDGLSYPLTGMIIKMKRKSLGRLLGGYYFQTTAFASLSMISFLINPDVVSFCILMGCKVVTYQR